MILLFMGSGLVFFICGALLIRTGYLSAVSESQKLKQELLKVRDSESRLKASSDALKVQLEKTQKNINSLLPLKELSESNLVHQEVQDKAIQQLEMEMKLLRDKAESQAADALEVINSLVAENETLKIDATSYPARIHQLEEIISKNKTEYETKIRETSSRIEMLTSENKDLKGQIEKSKAQIDQFKTDYEAIKGQNTADSNQLNALKSENTVLQKSLQETTKESQQFKEQILILQKKIDEEISVTQQMALEYENQVKVINNGLEEKSHLIKELEDKLISASGTSQEILSEKGTLIEELKKKNQALQDQITAQTAGNHQLTNSNQILQQQLDKNLNKLEEVQKELALTQSEHTTERQKAVLAIDELKTQNTFSQNQLEEYRLKIAQLETFLNSAQKQRDENLNSLQEHLQNLKTHEEQLTQARQTVEYLTTKNQALQNQIEEDSVRIGQVQDDLISTRKESQKQLEKKSDIVRQLESQLVFSQKESERQLQETQATIKNLKEEKDALITAASDLEMNLQKTKELNAFLLEKDEMMLYELSKNRAQAMGLEKICEDFKLEIETNLKSINALEARSRLLDKLQQETEGNFKDLKESHAELMEREKLSRYELEKNRAQLTSLEKLYSDFRARFESIGDLRKEPTEDEDKS